MARSNIDVVTYEEAFNRHIFGGLVGWLLLLLILLVNVQFGVGEKIWYLRYRQCCIKLSNKWTGSIDEIRKNGQQKAENFNIILRLSFVEWNDFYTFPSLCWIYIICYIDKKTHYDNQTNWHENIVIINWFKIGSEWYMRLLNQSFIARPCHIIGPNLN